MKHKIEIFSAGCHVCTQTIEAVKKVAGENEVHIHDMHQREVANRAEGHGIRRLPAVVIDGKLAACYASRGVDERVLLEALR